MFTKAMRFTLIELLVVIAILAAMLLPALSTMLVLISRFGVWQ